MRQKILLLIVAALFGVACCGIAYWVAQAAFANALIRGAGLPQGYRTWPLVSVAHEEGSLNDIRAILGNDVAIRAYQTGRLPFPDGAVIARLAWRYVPSPENDRAFGRPQSFVAGAPTNVQFMIKDSRKYASTGGWGFMQFNDGHRIPTAVDACYSCHVPVKARDFVFTRYSP